MPVRDCRFSIVDAEDRILGKIGIEQEAPPMPVFRNVRDAFLLAHAGVELCDVASFELDFSSQTRRIDQAGQCFDQLSLPISFNSRYTDNLSGMNLE